jgi:hypothetical protein
MKSIILLGMALVVRMVCSAQAADVTVKVADKAPPKEIGASITKVLQPKAIQVLQGDKPIYEFWFRNEVPLKSQPESPSKGLDVLEETTFLGVAVAPEARRDYRDDEIEPGTYTMRYGLQPQDGDHLGTSEYLFFVVLIPAKADTELDGIKKYRPMVKASGKATATGHPVVLSLRPPSPENGPVPAITDPAPGRKAVRVKLPAKAAGSDQATSLVFELVVEGNYRS